MPRRRDADFAVPYGFVQEFQAEMQEVDSGAVRLAILSRLGCAAYDPVTCCKHRSK